MQQVALQRNAADGAGTDKHAGTGGCNSGGAGQRDAVVTVGHTPPPEVGNRLLQLDFPGYIKERAAEARGA